MMALMVLAGCGGAPSGAAATPAGPAPDPLVGVPGRLVFLSREAATVVEAGERRRVGLPAGMSAATLSPDGRRVAGIVEGELVLLDLGSGEHRPVQKASLRDLAWSPDGSRLLNYGAVGDETMLALHEEGGERWRVTIPGSEPRQVAWAPDGSRLVLEVGGPYVTTRSLWLVELAEGKATLLAERANRPVWSPDGSALAYIKNLGPARDRVLIWREGQEPVVGASEEQLVAAFPQQASIFEKNDLYFYNLRWSPLGESLAAVGKAAGPEPRFIMTSFRPEGCPGNLWVLPVYLEHQRKDVQIHPYTPCSPGPYVWVKGGSQIAVLQNGPGCAGKMALLDASNLALLQEVEAPLGTLLASPDGDWVASSQEHTTRFIQLDRPAQPITVEGLGTLIHWSQP